MTTSAPLEILIADDEEGIRNVVIHWLEVQGQRVSAARNGLEAKRLLEQQRFDLVITDIVMPDGDGYEVIGTARKLQPAARILAISGGGRYLEGADCIRIARGLGAHATLAKPFNWVELRAGMEQAMPLATPASS